LIAYAWWNGPKDQWELRVVDRTSGVERVLISDTTLGYIRPYAFTHDAKFVVAGVSPAGAGASSLSLISVSTGARQSVVTYQGRDPQNAALSPDGRFLVYDVRDESSETNNRDIHIVSMSTHADTVLVHHPAADLAPSWSPRGEGVFFVSNRSGAPAGWYVPVQNGRATDSPRQVFQNFGTAAGLLGLTRDGALYYAPARANRRELYLADFDAAALAVIGQPQPLVSRTSGASEFPSWSADGKSLIYSAGSGADHVVRVRNAQTGSESETRTSAIRATLVTDSVAVINDAGRGGAPIRLSRLDLRTGKSDVLVERPDSGYNVSRFETSLGGKVLYYLLWKGARHTSLMRYDLETKSEREIYQSGDRMTTDFSVSPDGRQLAIVEDDRQGKRPGQRVRLLRVDGDASTDRLLGHTEPGGNIAGWLPGGRGLIVFVPRNGARELWLVPTDATSPRKLSASLPSGTAEVRLSPDGRRLVLRVDDYTREIWIAEHFLPSGGK
jgi:Tol biopolymer transport system component